MDFSVVVPVFNEEKCLEELVNRCLAACGQTKRSFELILIDDGSKDASPKMISGYCAAHPEVVGVFLNRNYGQHAAVMAGFAQSKGDIVITLDADLQNPPEEIPNLLAMTDAGHDVVGTIRRDRRDPWFRRIMSKAVNWMVRRATGVMMHDYGCMLRAYSREIIDALLSCRETTRFIPVLANSFAARPGEITVGHAERKAGDSKYSKLKLISLYFDLLTCMSTFPLRMATILGVVMSILGIVSGLILILGRIAFGSSWAVEGVFTMFAITFALLGVLYLAIGILGEYLGRVYNDVRSRPMYLVKTVVGGKESSKSKTERKVH